MIFFAKYIGLINIIFFITASLILVKISSIKDLKDYTLSHLATDKKIGNIFNVILFIFALSQTFFGIEVSRSLDPNLSRMIIPIFVLGGVALCFGAVFSKNNYPKVHDLTVVLSTISGTVGVVLLSLNLLSENFTLGLVVFGATLLIPLSIIIKRKVKGIYWELVVFLGIIVWNVVFSILLIYQ